MCLIAFAWQAHPDFPLVVAANRDEWHERPAAPAHWWPDSVGMLAGKDLKADGTWLGVTQAGRFAALTNFRDPSDRKSGAPTRGKLVSDYLQGSSAPAEYLATLRERAAVFEGFNLLAGDAKSLYCFNSRSGAIETVMPGVHALSNHTLDEPWPKVQQAKSALEDILQAKMAGEARQCSFSPNLSHQSANAGSVVRLPQDVAALKVALLALLSSSATAHDDELPRTGVGLEWERILSPIMIAGQNYGTRCSTALIVDTCGHAFFSEWTRDATGELAGLAEFEFGLGR